MNADSNYEVLLAEKKKLEQQVAAYRNLATALKKSEARYHQLSEYLPVVFYTSLPDTTQSNFFISGRMEKLTGYPAEQFMQDATLFARMIHPDDRARVTTEIRAALKNNGPVDTEYRITSATGETRWVRDRATPFYTDDRLLRMEGIMEDITEHKQAAAALREAHQTLLTVLDSIDATIYVADMDTYEVLFMNRHMKETFHGDFTGGECWQAFRKDQDGPCKECTNAQLIDSQGNPTGACIWEARNSVTDRWYINYDRAIKWLDGRWVRLQVATDITDVKNMEKERLRTEAQLRQAQKMEAIGTLAGGIAHDFNNILSAILGYSELALDESLANRPSANYIRQIVKAGYRARDLVQQILTFSRQTESEDKPIQVKPIVKEALKLLRASLPSTIEIKTDIESDAIVQADPTHIHQVIMNLCTNAGHAMRQKGGILKVSLKEENLNRSFTQQHPAMAPGTYIRLEVADTGHGIDAAIMDKIFDPYFTTKEKEEGTGMGLAMVQSIVQRCNGVVTVHSQKDYGTRFNVYFPVIHRKTEYESKIDTVVPGGSERILFVDDEPSLTNLGKQVLERMGYSVVVSNSSTEALAIYMQDPHAFDLVVTDMTMPHMTGDEMAEKMLQVRPGLPIVICTGYSEKITQSMIQHLGIQALIMKPLVRSEMALAIRQALETKPSE
jgi:two-component system cell cycle sensor histidine kinase/response regulator CckA